MAKLLVHSHWASRKTKTALNTGDWRTIVGAALLGATFSLPHRTLAERWWPGEETAET